MAARKIPFNHKLLSKYKYLSIFILTCLMSSVSVVRAEPSVDNAPESRPNPFEARIEQERKIRNDPFVLIPYKPNYLLATWDDTLDEQDKDNEPYETKFQISFKIPITPVDRDWTLYFAYTQLAVWQMANTAQSAPFRDTNYEPELMLYYVPKQAYFMGMRLRLMNFGIFNHQSNGQTVDKSRSWNRSYLETIFEIDRHYLGLKAWHRWKERPKNDPDDSEGDDNPNIEDYVGHGEIKYLYVGDEKNMGLTIRDTFHLNRDRHGSIQFDYTFPFSSFKKKGLRAYVQYFNGYGETLIDYDKKRERFGIGVMLADWL